MESVLNIPKAKNGNPTSFLIRCQVICMDLDATRAKQSHNAQTPHTEYFP